MLKRYGDAEDHSAFHHEAHLSQRADIFGRISFKRDQVGELTGPNRAAVCEMKDRRISARRLTQHFQRRKTVFVDEQLHLSDVVSMGEDANVAAHCEINPGCARCFHAGVLLLDSHRLGSTSFFPTAILFDRIAGRNRWAKRYAAFLHQFENFRRAIIAVLDRINAGENRAAHSLRGSGVRCHWSAGVMRRFDRRGNFFL